MDSKEIKKRKSNLMRLMKLIEKSPLDKKEADRMKKVIYRHRKKFKLREVKFD